MDAWKHGTYIDLWSFVHLLSGALLGIALHVIGFSFLWACALAALLLLTWELYEWVLGILEPLPNVTVDVLIGGLGFLLAAYWHYFLGEPFTLVGSSAVALATLGLSVWGFADLLFKGYR